ncbi:MAG TPA: hypothetical protein DCZ23_06885 [Lachnospiraceae bacterium]|nr:hypothetical protein [Lachnospiraceae bacterium]
MSCTLISGIPGSNTAFATTRESSAAWNVKQEEKSQEFDRVLAKCKKVKSKSKQIKIRKGESISVESIPCHGILSAAIMSNGDLYCWGLNSRGQVGNGTTETQLTQAKISCKG